MARAVAILSGVCAVASGVLSLVFAFGRAEWAITAWNLAIIPPALYLGLRLAARQPLLSVTSTAAGIGASLLWAYEFRNGTIEPWWIGLAALWWLGIGLAMLRVWGRTAWLTLVLGVTAAVDFVVTLMGLPLPWLALGGLKLPLTTLWSIWIGILLIREGLAGPMRLPIRLAAGAMAVVGGAVWMLCGAGWLLTHGLGAGASEADILGLRGTEVTRLMAIAAMYWAIALLGGDLRGDGAAARAAWATAVIGVTAVGSGALFETSLVDPDLDFAHPAVQGGWLLFIGGLLVAGAGLLAMAATGRAGVVSAACAVAGALAPMPVVAFTIGGLAAQGVAWTVLLAALHAAPGAGWVAIGAALEWAAPARQPSAAAA